MKKKDVLCREFLRGKVSRRDFNAGLLSMGLSATAASALVSQTITKAEAATPKKGGRLRVGLAAGSAGETLDPAKSLISPDFTRSITLYDRFVDRDTEGNLVPVLAESWESNDTVDDWVINLRKGVEFHNGKTVTSDDAKYSFERILDPKTGSPGKALLENIAEMHTDGPDKLRIKLREPDADLMYALNDYRLAIVPDGQTDFTGKPAGTGPWKVDSFEPGVKAVFVRNENYFVSGRPYIDEVESFGIPDNTARVNALLSGEVDIINTVDPQLVDLIKGSPQAKLLTIAGSSHPSYPMRADMEPYSNNDVRLAIKSAVDRQRYIDLAFNGFAVPGRDHPVPPHDPMHCDEIPVPKYDPEKAKFHLKKAGHENTEFELTGAESLFGGFNAILVLAEMMNSAGVNVKVKRAPTDGYWTNVWLKAPFYGGTWYGRPTAGLVLALAYHSEAKWNESHWKREDFDALLREARGTADVAKRKEILCAAQWMLHKEGSSVLPAFTNWIDAHSSRVKDLAPHPDGFTGWMQWDNVWLDS